MYFPLFADTSSFVMLLIYRLVFLFDVRMLLQYMFLSLFVVKLFIAICNILGIIDTIGIKSYYIICLSEY